MPNCIVKGCGNHSAKVKKKDGITFHIFPSRDQNVRELWISLIRDSRKEPLWKPTSRSVVCSAHFKIDDFYYTKKRLRRVLKNGYPKILPNKIEGSNNLDLGQAPSVKEEPAPGPSSNLSLTQPFSSSTVQTAHTDFLIFNTLRKHELIQSNIAQPYFPCTVQAAHTDSLIFNIPRKNELTQSNISQPYFSCTVQAAHTDSLIFNTPRRNVLTQTNLAQPYSSCIVQAAHTDSSIIDTPRKEKLQKRISLLEKTKIMNERKIRTLNQKVRRLHKSNKSLREKLDNIKKQNNIDIDLFNSLHGNIAVNLFNALNRKKVKKKKILPVYEKILPD